MSSKRHHHDDEDDETVFRRASRPILEHFAKRAASYIAGILITAIATAVTTILSSHQVAETKQQTHEINSGTNWIGQNLLQAHEEIWQSKSDIRDLQAAVNSMSNRLSELERRKIRP